MLVSPCRAWLGVAAEAPKPLQVMSSQAQGILEGETSAPAYRGADEQAGQDGRIPFLNGRDGRISEGAPRLEAVSVASAAEVVSDLPGTEPARMEPTGHGARDEEQRTLYPYRAQVSMQPTAATAAAATAILAFKEFPGATCRCSATAAAGSA